jgi:hypothetical protein
VADFPARPQAANERMLRDNWVTEAIMKTLIASFLFAFCVRTVLAESPNPELEKLVAKIGATFWSPPEKRLVRGTQYKKGRGASDSESAKGISTEKIGLQYASKDKAGTLAVPAWLPRGSMVKIHSAEGVLSYIAADEGQAVEACKGAKRLGKTEEEKAAAVLDFCAEKQLWPDFIIVDIYYYSGKVAFADLSIEEQKLLFNYAAEYVEKRE